MHITTLVTWAIRLQKKCNFNWVQPIQLAYCLLYIVITEICFSMGHVMIRSCNSEIVDSYSIRLHLLHLLVYYLLSRDGRGRGHGRIHRIIGMTTISFEQVSKKVCIDKVIRGACDDQKRVECAKSNLCLRRDVYATI